MIIFAERLPNQILHSPTPCHIPMHRLSIVKTCWPPIKSPLRMVRHFNLSSDPPRLSFSSCFRFFSHLIHHISPSHNPSLFFNLPIHHASSFHSLFLSSLLSSNIPLLLTIHLFSANLPIYHASPFHSPSLSLLLLSTIPLFDTTIQSFFDSSSPPHSFFSQSFTIFTPPPPHPSFPPSLPFIFSFYHLELHIAHFLPPSSPKSLLPFYYLLYFHVFLYSPWCDPW